MNKTRPELLLMLLINGLALLLITYSCKHKGVPADQMPEICFTEQVLPIFLNNCGTKGCHDGNGNRSESGYAFTDYASIMKAISPGSASNSKAYQSMISSFNLMPPNNALSTNNRTIIRLWIEQGAKETSCGTTKSSGINLNTAP